jgi:hypothetical protein
VLDLRGDDVVDVGAGELGSRKLKSPASTARLTGRSHRLDECMGACQLSARHLNPLELVRRMDVSDDEILEPDGVAHPPLAALHADAHGAVLERDELRDSRIAFACPVTPERNRTGSWRWRTPPSHRGTSVRFATALRTVIPLHSASDDSDQSGSSCRHSTSGRSWEASSTISRRCRRRPGGEVRPW